MFVHLAYVARVNSPAVGYQLPYQFFRVTPNSLKIMLFGAPRVLRDGRSLHGKATQRRRLALLALLAAAPSRALTRDRLVGFVWPERDVPQARKLLSEALYIIRRELGEAVVLTPSSDLVVLDAGAIDCDLWEFDEAVAAGAHGRAAGLSDAPFLDGLFLDDAEEFTRWLDGERRRISAARESALARLATDAEQDARWLEAAAAWERLLHDDPLSSRWALSAARAHASGGEVAAALQLLATHERRLMEELGAPADPEVVALLDQLRQRRAPADSRIGDQFMAASLTTVPTRHTAPDGAAGHAPRGAMSAPGVRGPRPRVWFVAVIGLLLAGLAGGAYWSRGVERAVPLFDERRVAVLYFRDASPEGDLGSVADLITESLIEQLAGSRAFEVVPVSGARLVRGEDLGADSIARRFRAGSIVDGSVHRRGERLLVSVRLLDAATGVVLASSRLERGLYELLALEEDVAREVAIGIRQRLGQDVRLAELRGGSSNVRAWQLIARGNRERADAVRWHSVSSEDGMQAAQRGLRRADSLFEQAQIEDPDWVRPAVERGWTALDASNWEDGAARVAILERAIARADSIPPEHGRDPAVLEMRSALRWSRLKALTPPFDLEEVGDLVRDLEEAVAADSTRARGLATLSNIFFLRGEVERAEAAGRRALDADAYIEEAPRIYQNLFASALFRSPIDSARAWCARGRRDFPDDWWFRECQLTIMKYDLRAPADPARAWRVVAEVDSLDPPAAAAAEGHAYAPIYRRLVAAAVSARAGDLPRARLELARQRAAVAGDSLLALDLIPEEVTLLLLFGDRESAVARLRWAIARRPLLSGVVARDPILQGLASEVASQDAPPAATPLRLP